MTFNSDMKTPSQPLGKLVATAEKIYDFVDFSRNK
jgi:hypothetical protein